MNIETKQFENIFSLGFEDHSKVAIYLNKSDGVYDPKTYEKIKGIRMPDGISVVAIGGQTYLLTANTILTAATIRQIFMTMFPRRVFSLRGDKNSSGVSIVIASDEVSGTVSVTALDIDAAPTEEEPGKPQHPEGEPQPPKEEPGEPQSPEKEPNLSRRSEGETSRNENGELVSPKTGDGTDPVLWLAGLLISSMCVLGAAVYGSKKQKKVKGK